MARRGIPGQCDTAAPRGNSTRHQDRQHPQRRSAGICAALGVSAVPKDDLRVQKVCPLAGPMRSAALGCNPARVFETSHAPSLSRRLRCPTRTTAGRHGRPRCPGPQPRRRGGPRSRSHRVQPSRCRDAEGCRAAPVSSAGRPGKRAIRAVRCASAPRNTSRPRRSQIPARRPPAATGRAASSRSCTATRQGPGPGPGRSWPRRPPGRPRHRRRPRRAPRCRPDLGTPPPGGRYPERDIRKHLAYCSCQSW